MTDPRSTPSIPVAPEEHAPAIGLSSAGRHTLCMADGEPWPCRTVEASGESRPTPVEPEALREDRIANAMQAGYEAATGKRNWDGSRLAVEPDGLPLDVPRLLQAMRDHCHDSADEGLPILLRHKHLDPFIRDDCGSAIAAEYGLASTPSEAKP